MCTGNGVYDRCTGCVFWGVETARGVGGERASKGPDARECQVLFLRSCHLPAVPHTKFPPVYNALYRGVLNVYRERSV